MEVAGRQRRGGPCALEFAVCVGFALAEEPVPRFAQGMYVLRPSTADANLEKSRSVHGSAGRVCSFKGMMLEEKDGFQRSLGRTELVCLRGEGICVLQVRARLRHGVGKVQGGRVWGSN